MRIALFLTMIILTINGLSQDKPSIQVINQSEKYKIVDNTFKIRKQFGDSSTVRLKTEISHPIETGNYLVSINFYARWGIYSN